ncbi:hypothetical protein [Streptomyces sp. NPDC000961]|uniref:hypothetical protein n=1 Tax=Streptomyces TaxID=1883 RepID=UPI0036CEC7C5
MPSTIQHKDVPITATPQFHAISPGAGIQSNTMLALWAEKILPNVDYAVLANSGRGPKAVSDKLPCQTFLHRSQVPLNQAPVNHGTEAEWAARRQDHDSAKELKQSVNSDRSPWACPDEAEAAKDGFGLTA